MSSEDVNLLIAPCGINCGVCMAHLRERNKCPGCRAPSEQKPKTRVICKIKTCEFFKNTGAKFCYQCPSFPCANLKHLDTRYKTKYHMSEIKNLENIRKMGLAKFLSDEKARWTCPACGGTICVHTGRCVDCQRKHR